MISFHISRSLLRAREVVVAVTVTYEEHAYTSSKLTEAMTECTRFTLVKLAMRAPRLDFNHFSMRRSRTIEEGRHCSPEYEKETRLEQRNDKRKNLQSVFPPKKWLVFIEAQSVDETNM